MTDFRLLNFFCLVAFICVVIWNLHFRPGLSFDSPNLFQWHPLLMTICFGMCLPQATVMYRRQSFARETRKNLHGGVMLFGLFCAVFGLVAVIKYHDDSKLSHYYSLHSWLGIATFVILCVQWVLGVTCFGSANIVAPPTKSRFMPIHKFTGTFLLIVSTATLTTGILEKNTFEKVCYPSVTDECKLSNFLGLVFVCTSAATFYVMQQKPASGGVDAEATVGLLSG